MFFDVVEHLDPTGEVMVARVPQEGSGDFTLGSQCVVQDSQVAVFYTDGKMADQFTAGRYTLSTMNLPILKGLSKIAFKGKSPFRAYVYFVNLKRFIDMGWGTPEPILFRDSELKMVNLRAYGTFTVRIVDHVRFLNTIVGTQGMESTTDINHYLRGIVVSRFARVLPDQLTTVIDLASEYQNIEVAVKDATREDFSQYGLELTDLFVKSITLPPEVQQIIDRAAGTRSMASDEILAYQQVSAADALREAAASGGGGELAGGLGIGAGLAMGTQFAAHMQPTTHPQGGAPQGGPPPLPGSQQQATWYAGVGGERVGPFTAGDLKDQIHSAKITEDTLMWREGMADWVPAKDVPEIAGLFGAVPPPLPPQAT